MSVTQKCYCNELYGIVRKHNVGGSFIYNKLFTKILDSSIWLESDATRIVWITFLAVMDQDGFVALSTIGNVANRARVSEEKAVEAIRILESPDVYNPDQEQQGRRIERVPGVGWIVLNSKKYKDIIKAETLRMQTRERVKKHRQNKRCNADVTQGNENVTPSETETETYSHTEERVETPQAASKTTKSAKRGTRIPEPFLLTAEMRTYAKEKRPNVDVLEETEKFTNYWRAVTGRNATKLDWTATWRNWILNAKGANNGTNSRYTERDTTLDRIKRQKAILANYPSEADIAAAGS